MFISTMKLLSNETNTRYETDDSYLLSCCKYFETFIVAKVQMETTPSSGFFLIAYWLLADAFFKLEMTPLICYVTKPVP